MNARGADVVVIGAGVVGAAVAFHLASSGAHVIVLDRRGVAAGATGASAGFVRVYHAQAPLTRLAHDSWPELAGWDDLVGGSIGFVVTGCVHDLRGSDSSVDPAAHGVDVDWQIVRAPDLRERFPELHMDEDAVVLYEPSAGYAAPSRCAEQYLRRVIDLGGSVSTGVIALELQIEGGRVTGVATSAGPVSAPSVVVALGPWAASSSLVELDVSLRTKRIVTQRVALAGDVPAIPAYIDEGSGFFFRPDGPGDVLIGGGSGEWGEHPGDPAPEQNPSSLQAARTWAEHRLGIPITCAEVISGLDAYTTDALPIIDRYPGADGVYVATGFSGTGFKTAPAVGRGLASWIGTGTRDELLAPFAIDRFANAERAERAEPERAEPTTAVPDGS